MEERAVNVGNERFNARTPAEREIKDKVGEPSLRHFPRFRGRYDRHSHTGDYGDNRAVGVWQIVFSTDFQQDE
jgi:hypothetical protein